VAFGDGRSEAVVQLRAEAIYELFVEKLWRAVCVRLMFEMIAALEQGKAFYFGDMAVDNSTVTLTKHRLLGRDERMRLSWRDVVMSSANGDLVITSATDREVYGSAAYISTANTRILEHIIRTGFSKGIMKLSDVLNT
jgi:hypothetical protein